MVDTTADHNMPLALIRNPLHTLIDDSLAKYTVLWRFVPTTLCWSPSSGVFGQAVTAGMVREDKQDS